MVERIKTNSSGTYPTGGGRRGSGANDKAAAAKRVLDTQLYVDYTITYAHEQSNLSSDTRHPIEFESARGKIEQFQVG